MANNTVRHINIIGHQNPDTDSICSALAYAWLKNRGSLTGLYEARRTGAPLYAHEGIAEIQRKYAD